MSIINMESALPLNRQVENYLRRLIAQEKYQNGELLPTEMQLTQELGVARNTVRTAMDKLVREGVVSRKKGVGTQVNRAPVVTNLTKWRSFATELGDQIHTESRDVTLETVEGEIARELGALDGQEVTCLKRLKASDTEVMALLVSYFPRELNIEADETFEGRLYEVLETILHRQGYQVLYGVVTGENERSCRFHEAMGFTLRAEFPNAGFKKGRWIGTYWYEKRLRQEDPLSPPVPWLQLDLSDILKGEDQ